MKSKTIIVFNLFCCLTFLSYGTAMMDYFLVYPSRAIVGEKEFVEYHDLLEAAILPISVLPFFVITILNGILILNRPTGAPKGLLVASMACLAIVWMSSIFVQIPMNIQLGNGKNIALIQKVMNTNWGRVVFESTQAIIVFILLMKVMTGTIERRQRLSLNDAKFKLVA